MKPVIAVDCDGVLTDNYIVWERHYAKRVCGRDHASKPSTDVWDSWKTLCQKCWGHVLHTEEILYAHQLYQGVVSTLHALSLRADLYVVTSRPQSTREITRNWLFWNGIYESFKDVIVTEDKRSVCDSLGAAALIDDAPRNIEALKGSGTVPIIYDTAYNRHLDGIRVFNWEEARFQLMKQVMLHTV